MIKLRTNLGIALLLLLSSCNAFRQKVTVGPGTGEFKDHTFEILLMLAGAFALGLWLGWILWNKYKSMVEGLRMENESLTTSVNNYRTELEALKLKFSSLDTEKNELQGVVNSLSWENSDFKGKILNLEGDLSNLLERNRSLETEIGLLHASTPESAEVPMEIITSPVDVHVEDLAQPIEEEIGSLEEEIVAEIPEPEPLPEIEEEIVAVQEEPIVVEEEIPVVIEPHIEEIPVVEVDTRTKYAYLEEVNIPIKPMTIQEVPVHVEVKEEETLMDILGEPEPIEPIETIVHHAAPEITETVVVHHAAPEITETIVVHHDAVPETVIKHTSITTPVVAVSNLADQLDDFKIVEGIGPKIEELLQRNGIKTFTQLAATPVNRIKEILVSGGSNYALHDPSTWPAQALLAANGEWDNLKSYQSFLNAGKRP